MRRRRRRPRHVQSYRIQRRRSGDEQPIPLWTAERQVGCRLGKVQLADQRSIGIEAVQSLADTGPYPSGVVQANAVEHAGGAFREQRAVAEAAVRLDRKDADVIAPGVCDVEQALVE